MRTRFAMRPAAALPRFRNGGWLWALLAAAVLITPGAAQALVPVDSPMSADLLLPQGPEAITRVLTQGAVLPAAAQTQADHALYDFAQAVGGRWDVLAWNPVTLTPRLVTGTGIASGSIIDDRAGAESVARRFIDQGHVLWGVGSDDLAVRKVSSGLQNWSAHFTQQCAGLPVIGSRLAVTMTETGRIFAFGGDLWPELQAPSQALLSEAAAHQRALAELQNRGLAPATLGARDRLTTETYGILPASATEGYLVYRVDTFFHEPLGAWLVDVDARSGEILQIQNVLRALSREDFTGTIMGDIEDPGWCFGSDTLAVPLMGVTITNAGSDTTGIDGTFSLPFAGSEPESVFVEFLGPYVNVNNTEGLDSRFAGEITPGEPFLLQWDESNARWDERDVFHHTNKVHEYIKAIDPNWTDFDFALPANVNLQSSCNAFWDGESINFYHEAGGCANTGRLGDVIHHEFGHGITTFMYVTPQPGSDMHEANSDVVGNYLCNESKMGRGFYLDDCENGIRESDNDLRWPDDLGGGGHHDGQILAGFHWHARENMMLSLGEEAGHWRASEVWHFSRELGLPMMQPEQVWWSFIADDDDGNLDNGTPNYDDLCPAAQRHGFECPERFDHVVIHHQAFQYAPAPGEEPIEIAAEIYSFDGEMNPDSMFVYYRLMGGAEFQAALFVPLRENEYVAEIPHQPVTTMVEYYIEATDMLHNTETDPREAPAELHSVIVVTAYDPFEAESDWTIGAPGDDATQGIWEWCDPNGAQVGPNIVQPEDDATADPGAFCWITGQYSEGYPWFSDADGQTTLTSSVYDLSGSDWAHLWFCRWFQTVGSALGTMDIDVSNDAGATWVNIDHVEGFHPDAEWTLIQVDISHLFLEPLDQVQVRLVMYGYQNPSIDEGGIDEFVLLAGSGLSDIENNGWSDASPAGVPLQLRLASGNPLVGQRGARIHFGLPQTGAVRLAVLDLTGRVVTSLQDGVLPAGPHELVWSGSDAHGRMTGSGVYFLRLATPQGTQTTRMVIAR